MTNYDVKIIGKKLLVDGFVYLRSRVREEKSYWDCRRVRSRECKARAVSMPGVDGGIVVIRGPQESAHSHPPDQEECESEVHVHAVKRKAKEHPEQPRAQILRTHLSVVRPEVLSHLPERESLKRAMRRQRRRGLPPNPKSIQDVGRIPERYTKTLLGEQFLLFDSGEGEDRVLGFATRKNVELLGASDTWFLDGIFKVLISYW